MARWGMVIDMDKCTGCQACVVVCQVENNLPVVGPTDVACGRSMQWLETIPFHEGQYPHARLRLLPIGCQHCDSPPCTKVCPVGATYKNPEGLVAQIYYRCIGCRYCTNNCPYTIKTFNWHEPYWPDEMKEGLNPDVTIRQVGIVEKCTFCHHRLQRAREQAKVEQRELMPGDYIPACVQACPAKAMYFGDLDDPNSEVSEQARSPRARHLTEEVGTHPKVIYLNED